MTKEINDVKGGMESPAVRRKMEDDENKAKRGTNDENLGAVTNIEKENSKFIRGQQQIQKEQINQQDVQIGRLGEAVTRLDGIGRTINTELKEQNVLLQELDDDLDDAGNKMNVVMAKLSKLLKTKDGCQIWTIVILAVILVILVAVTIFV
jgi:hypothetical protein